MNKLKKIVSLCLTIMLVFSFMAMEVSADEGEEQELEMEVVVDEADDLSEEVQCEISTNASILITLDADYLVTVGLAMEVLEVEGFTQESVDLLTTMFTDSEGIYDVTTSSLEELIQLLMEQVILVEGEDSPELELMVSAEDEALLSKLEEALEATFDVEVESELEDPSCDEDAQPESILTRFKMAEALGINPGRMHLLEKYIDSLDLEEGESFTLEELEALTELSVKDIMQGTKANKKSRKFEDKEASLIITEDESEEEEATEEADVTEEADDEDTSDEKVKESKKSQSAKSAKEGAKGNSGKSKGKNKK